METKERKHDMHKVDRDILVSASDVSKEEQEEVVDDLDNQEYSEGEKYD